MIGVTANIGRGIGWTSCASPNPTVGTKTRSVRTCGGIAITWSTRSTVTSRIPTSFATSWRATKSMKIIPEHLAAAGFLRLGIFEYNQRDARGHWNDIMNEMTGRHGRRLSRHGNGLRTMSRSQVRSDFAKGLLSAARVFLNQSVGVTISSRQQRNNALPTTSQFAKWKEATKDVQARIDALIKPYHDRKWKSTVAKFPLDIQACFNKPVEERSSWEHQMAYLVERQFYEEGGGPLRSIKAEDKAQRDAWLKELAAFNHLKPKPLPTVTTVTDFRGPAAPTIIPEAPDAGPIKPGFLTVLSHQDVGAPPTFPALLESTGRRTALAKWIGREDNPITTRVIVNRVWQEHFGEGIVSTANDFGRLGKEPTHPDLLDWLTATFVEDGWSIKRLHKQVLMSAAWQQSSHHPQADKYREQDPGESLLWRSRVRRLKAEQIRDAMLVVSGELDSKIGGPSVDADVPRRSLYIKRRRNTPAEFLHAFDTANGLKSVSQRNRTTTPIQSLMMFNGDYTLGRAKRFAKQLQVPAEQREYLLPNAFRWAWGRSPTSDELRCAQQFTMTTTADGTEQVGKDRLIDFCHVLLNSNEFLYID